MSAAASIRPGREHDLPRLIDLWRRDARAGRQDVLPGEPRLRAILQRFDWEARSRVVENGDALDAAVLISSRSSPDGVIVTASIAGAPVVTAELTRWALRLARAGGAYIVQVYAAHGARSLEQFGFSIVRPWLRMDLDLDRLREPRPVPGYHLIDGTSVKPGEWERTFNRSFADHWRFSPRSEDEILGGKPAGLCAMAVAGPAGPAAIALAELETYVDDERDQPVGLISSVGTVPEHRRRGLATWLVGELLHRVREQGARSASLYVDGMSQMRAFDAYRKLGFEVTFASDVWEATVR